jgi:hypothetical protein
LRTFAPTQRTSNSLAADLGVGRERVHQLETLALQSLACAAAHDRYRPLHCARHRPHDLAAPAPRVPAQAPG